MPNFTGTLNANEIFAGLFNMIISQEVFADNVAEHYSDLVDAAKVDGGLYGDTKLYYSTDVLKSAPWGNDAESTKLLQLYRPEDPKCQAIELDTFRQISLTVDSYLTKRAWMAEGAFASFNSVMLSWIQETKRIYEVTTYNAFIGTKQSNVGKQTITLTIPNKETTGLDTEAQARYEAQSIAREIANLITRLKDITRDYNDYGFLRSYAIDSLMFVVSADVYNEILKIDLPTIFHKDGLIEKLGEHVLPSRYFGDVNSDQKVGDGTTIRSLIEQDVKKNGSTDEHVFAGDLIPTGYTATAGTSYTENPKILFKVIHRRSIPFMSAFEAGTSFFNPKSLTENHYLTWGHNTLEYLKQYPMITVKKA